MSIHEQLDLVFEIETDLDGSIYFRCAYYKESPVPYLQGAIMDVLKWDMNSNSTSLSESLIEDINNILNGTFIGSDGDGNITDDFSGNTILRLNLEDGFAYFDEDGVSEPPTMLLTDLKILLQEWVAFRNSVHGID